MEGAKHISALGNPNGEFELITTELMVSHTALAADEAGYNLHLYTASPPSALADNAAWDLPSGDRAYYAGVLALGTPVDLGSTLYVAVNGIYRRLRLDASGGLWAYLVTAAGITPTAAARTVRLTGR